MEDWGRKFEHMRTPDSSVPSHREELRKRLESHNIPAGRGRRTAVTMSLALLITLGALTVGYPSWAKDLWNTAFIQTITLRTDDGMKVVIKRMPLDQCGSICDSTMQMCEAGGRRVIAFKKRLNTAEMNSDSFNISTEAILKELNLSETGAAKITISTPDCDKTWIINGDTVDASHMTVSYDQIPEVSTGPEEEAIETDKIASAPDNTPAASADFKLNQNYPNPFNPSTQISFDLDQSGPVTLKVFNMMGQEITTLLNGYTDAGHHAITFDGANLPSGTYLYTLQTAKAKLSKMMILAK